MAKLLYVTGFGPFPNVDENPTELIVQRLAGRTVGDFRVESEVLPTSWKRGPDAVRARMRTLSSRGLTGIVHLGFTHLDTIVRVESWACNEMDSRYADVDDEEHNEVPIDPDAEINHVYETSFDVPEVVARLRAAAVPARLSRNAGRYVCNCVYYSTLDQLFRNGSSVPALFAHLPPIGLRPFGDLEFEPWDDERLLNAAEVLLDAVARQLATD